MPTMYQAFFYLLQSPQQPNNIGMINIPTLQMNKLKHKKVK